MRLLWLMCKLLIIGICITSITNDPSNIYPLFILTVQCVETVAVAIKYHKDGNIF